MFVSDLYVHPIKSTAAIKSESLLYSQRGPKYDREWMLVDHRGKFMSQRTSAKMCFIESSLEDEKLRLSAPGQSSLDLPQALDLNTAESVLVTVWKDEVSAADCGDQAAAWCTEVLGEPCRLVKVHEQTKRLVDTDFAHDGQTVGFADGYPTLIVSQASLDEFNSHLDAAVDMRRFRPNIVVSGCEPYAEDNWRKISINDMEFDLVKPCSRCIVPSINPDTAAKEMQINDVLLRTRRRERSTYFGQNALHRGLGEIKLGDEVELLA